LSNVEDVAKLQYVKKKTTFVWFLLTFIKDIISLKTF
jgi:hypothetical protein